MIKKFQCGMIFLVLAVVFAILFLPEIYVWKTIIVSWQFSSKVLYIAPILLVFIVFLLIYFETDSTDKMRHFGFAMFALLCLQIPKLVFTLIGLVGKLASIGGVSQTPFFVVGLSLAGITLLAMLYSSFIDLYRFQIRNVEFHSAKIPQSFDGYKIVQLSDIHTGSWNKNGKKLTKAINLVNAQNPDVVLFTGDLISTDNQELAPFADIFATIRATDGVFSVLGNHDYSMGKRQIAESVQQLIQKERAMGWKMLLNSNVKIERNGDSIAIIGVKNAGRPPFPNESNLSQAMIGTENMFRILLSHDPNHWRDEVIPHTDIPLTLAGHTHAAQIDVPLLRFSKLAFKEYRGMYTEGEQSLYVNVGLGYTFFPIRLGVRPEITVITLKKD